MAAELAGPGSGADAAATLHGFETWLTDSPDAKGVPLGRGYQATTELYRSPVGAFVVKKARGPWPWRCLGEAAIRREHAIYRRIRNVPGVPRCIGVIEGRMLVLEHVDGGTFRKREHQLADWDAFFVRLLDTIRGIHAAGVAHGDLKRKDNILVGAGEQPYIVDFGVASVARQSGVPGANAVFRWMRQYDYNAWVKLKYQRRLDDLTPADAALYAPTLAEQAARMIRVVWQTLTLRRVRRRIWPRR